MGIGEMAEWLMAADCKSADVSLRRFESFFAHRICECSSVGRASAFQAEGRAFESRHSLNNCLRSSVGRALRW
jgi:hypothetical protein